MPPVLDVALEELARGGAQQYARGRSLVSRPCSAMHVLQLIAETVRAAQLIERRARPYAARKRLIEQPTIEQHVHAGIGCCNLHGAEDFVPLARDVAQNLVEIGGCDSDSSNSRACSLFSVWPRKNTISTRAPGRSSIDGLQRGARIEARAHFSGKRRARSSAAGALECRCGREIPCDRQ